MFVEAYGAAKEFARPVLLSDLKGSWVGCGTFIVLNRSGWIVTAKHNISEAMEDHCASSVWGWDGVGIDEAIFDDATDMAAGRLDPFDPEWVSEYPLLSDGSGISIGGSFGRLGYAIEEGDDSALAAPLFNSGIISQIRDGPDMRCIITSSAGMKGQSGGPLFDSEGYVIGMQTLTRCVPLGYSGANDDGVMKPLMSIEGMALHIDSMRRFLDAAGISYRIE